MKTFAKLSILFLVALQSTVVFGSFQAPSNTAPKNYLNMEMLHFSENGIYLHGNHGQPFRLEQIQFDSNGYFVAGFLDFLLPKANVIVSCRSCHTEYYNRSPQPCENCHQTRGFDIIQIDDGYDN